MSCRTLRCWRAHTPCVAAPCSTVCMDAADCARPWPPQPRSSIGTSAIRCACPPHADLPPARSLCRRLAPRPAAHAVPHVGGAADAGRAEPPGGHAGGHGGPAGCQVGPGRGETRCTTHARPNSPRGGPIPAWMPCLETLTLLFSCLASPALQRRGRGAHDGGDAAAVPAGVCTQPAGARVGAGGWTAGTTLAGAPGLRGCSSGGAAASCEVAAESRPCDARCTALRARFLQYCPAAAPLAPSPRATRSAGCCRRGASRPPLS